MNKSELEFIEKNTNLKDTFIFDIDEDFILSEDHKINTIIDCQMYFFLKENLPRIEDF